MTYPIINSRRMPYDIDGTAVGYRAQVGGDLVGLFGAGMSSWVDSTGMGNMNSSSALQEWGLYWQSSPKVGLWFFFPELREITNLAVVFSAKTSDQSLPHKLIQGSADTTNGVDGTWETATYSMPTGVVIDDVDAWRKNIFAVSFSGPVKALRIGFGVNGGTGNSCIITNVHIYGMKAAGQTPDDILFTDVNGDELSSLTDWGDQPEGTTELWWFKLKNASTTKIANAVNLQLNHSDFAIALSEDGPWVSVLDITSIAANSLSATIYVRNKLGPPLLILGPRQARCIVTVGSWT